MSTFTINKYSNGNTLKQNILIAIGFFFVCLGQLKISFFFVTETGMYPYKGSKQAIFKNKKAMIHKRLWI